MEVAGKIPELQASELLCLPCSLDGKAESVHGYCIDCEEHLCEPCFKHHKKPRPTRNHMLLDKYHMPIQHMPTRNTHDDQTSFCSSHADKRVEFYCHEHQIAACYVCCTLEHKLCDVKYIPDIAGNIIESDELKTVTDKLKGMRRNFESCIAQAKANKKKVQHFSENVLKEMKLFREKIEAYLDEMEADLEGNLEVIESRYRETLSTVHAEYKDIDKELNAIESNLSSLAANNKINQLFIEMHKAKVAIDLIETRGKQTHEMNKACYSIEFIRNEKLFDVLKEEKLGEIVNKDVTENTELDCAFDTNTPDQDMVVDLSFCNALPVQSPLDCADCNILGLTILPSLDIVVADYNNKSVKIIDTGSNTLITEKLLSSGPRDIVYMHENTFAVAQPDKRCIQTLFLSKGKLFLGRRFSVEEKCFCLAFNDGKYVVGCDYHPGNVLIMDIAGNLLKKFSLSGILDGPEKIIVSADMKSLYVSDSFLTGKCVRLDWDGNVLNTTEEDDIELSGIQELEDGSLLVCQKDKTRIVRLSNSLEECGLIDLEYADIKSPTAIAYCESEKKLYISCSSSSFKDESPINLVKSFCLDFTE